MDHTIAAMALTAGNTSDFELFGQITLQVALGIEFEPTGGMHDGGQDGFLRPVKGRPDRYVQISMAQDYRKKINATIKRIQESGRSLNSLTYVTPFHVPEKDLLEASVEKTTGVAVRVCDQRWLVVSMHAHSELIGAFKDRYASVLNSLREATDHVQRRYATTERLSVLVYLENHAKSEPRDADLLTLAVDAAIFMALKDTDPDQKLFRLESEIIEFVETFFPAVKSRATSLVPTRLAHLKTKKGNPRIRAHPGEKYALPFEVRSEFSEQNALLAQIEGDFWNSVKARATALRPDISPMQEAVVEDAVAFALTKTFEQQGINLIAATQGADSFDEIRTYEYVRESLTASTTDATLRRDLEDCVATILRNIFYSGTSAENQYLYRLFKLYSIDFMVRGDEKVWRYFRNVARKLVLVVGTDILVRALSEICVLQSSQATQNALRILKSLGVELILTEHVLQEVYTHIKSADREYQHFYEPWAQQATLADGKQCPKILIRAFFYSKFEPERHAKGVSNWDEFLNMFGSAAWFREDTGKRAFAAFLRNKFGLAFHSKQTVEDMVPYITAKRLAEEMVTAKHNNFELALNDAYMIHYVDELRKRNNEVFGNDVHGYATWWLTEESHAVQIAKKHGLYSIKMQPQFLMNFVVAIPGLRESGDPYANAFPTIFGLRITNRVGDDVMREFLNKAVEVVKADAATAQAKIRDLSNRMMSQHYH